MTATLHTRDDADFPGLIKVDSQTIADCYVMRLCSSREEAVARSVANRDNARRLAACWNACDGASTEDLERHGFLAMRTRQLAELERHRGEMLALLRRFHAFALSGGNGGGFVYPLGSLEQLQAIIDKYPAA